MTVIRRLLRRALGRGRMPSSVPASRLALRAPGNQWYAPVFAGPDTLGAFATGGEAVRRARAVLERLDCDDYHRFVLDFYAAGLRTFGDRWVYADLYTALSSLAAVMQPARYLEIGVRKGHSLAMVLSQAPACQAVAFDLWAEGYAGLDNPGPEFVRGQLARAGCRGDVTFVDGDSARTVPAWLRAHPEVFFDLVTVDGDHSARGAAADLANVLPRVALGGVVAFDDLANPAHPELRGVWERVVGADGRFRTWRFDQTGFGVGLALRVR